MRHFPPFVKLFLVATIPRAPPCLLPIFIVEFERHILHFHHTFFAEDDEFCGMRAASIAFAVVGTPDGGVKKGLNDSLVKGWWILQVALREDGATIADAGEDGEVSDRGSTYFPF